MTIKNENRFIQYELWKECRNGCEFCFNRGQKSLDKIERLNYIIDKLNDPEVDSYNEIGFIGGEFFDIELRDEKVQRLFFQLFRICADKVQAGKLDKIYVTTGLIFDIKPYLIPFLEFLRIWGLSDKTLLCTSYDTKYRFHTPEKLKLWEDNMKYIHEHYNEVKLHTEIIITQDFINKVLDDTFNITKFKEEFNTAIDYIEPSSGFYFNDKKQAAEHLIDFFPTKTSFIKFLKKVSANNDIDLTTFLSMELRSNKIYTIDYEPTVIDNRRDINTRIIPRDKTKKYELGFIDSDDKMIDVVKTFGSLYG